jgi:hypothetical protein
MTRYLKVYALGVALLVCGLTALSGCQSAAPPRVPDHDTRARADRAFEDLGDAEAGRPIRSRQSRTEEAGGGDGTQRIPTAPPEAGRAPDWIAGTGLRYPADRFLTAVGYGQDRPAAEDKARAEIAKIFFSEIDASNRTIQSIMESTAGGRTQSRESVDFEEIINVSTRKILSGVRIAEVYGPPRGQSQIYALAVLDRNQAQTILKSKIDDLDRDIHQLLDTSERQSQPLLRIKALHACVQKHALRQAYDAELRIVDPRGKGIPSRVNFAAIHQRLNDVLLKEFFIAVSVQGARAEDIRRALTEAINQRGFAVSGDPARAAVLARGRVDINPIDQKVSGWKFVRWNAYFDLVDRRGGAVFGSVQHSGKEGHLTLGQAEERAVRKIRKTLAADISADLKKYILSGNPTD